MYTFLVTDTRPQYNLALEEYLYTKTKDEYFFLWQNEPSIIVGRNQYTPAEIDLPLVFKENIHVVRRITGGGAVYHDLGNINFTFISNADEKAEKGKLDFHKYSKPIVDALNSMGIAAEINGRNDLVVDGKKISGAAQTVRGNRILHHGTLLFHSDLTKLSSVLKVKSNYANKGVKSVASRVTNIVETMENPISTSEFMKTVYERITHHLENATELYPEFSEPVGELVKNRYSLASWNFSNASNAKDDENRMCSSVQSDFGKLEVEKKIDWDTKTISEIKFFGDFFGSADKAELEEKLIGISYEAEEVRKLLTDEVIKDTFFGFTWELVEKVMFDK